MTKILKCTDISKYYIERQGLFKAKKSKNSVLKNISFSIKQGETLGLVGPSGCGKSTLARIVAGLMPPSSGKISLKGKELKSFSDFIGSVQMVFQNPFSSLNPKLKIGYSVQEPLLLKYKKEKKLPCTISSILRAFGTLCGSQVTCC